MGRTVPPPVHWRAHLIFSMSHVKGGSVTVCSVKVCSVTVGPVEVRSVEARSMKVRLSSSCSLGKACTKACSRTYITAGCRPSTCQLVPCPSSSWCTGGGRNVSFSGCSATRNGGAVSVLGAPQAELYGVTVTGSRAATGDGGAVAVVNSELVTVTGLAVSRCAARFGGGMNVTSSAVSLSASAFSACSATARGGCLGSFDATVRLDDTTMASCTALGDGGCWGDTGSSMRVTNSHFRGCASGSLDPAYGPTGSGGCVTLEAYQGFTMRGGSMEGCSAQIEGGCMNAYGKGAQFTVDLGHTAFQRCNLTARSGFGGALRLSNSTLLLRDSTLASNFVEGGPGDIAVGGAVATSDAAVTIQRWVWGALAHL